MAEAIEKSDTIEFEPWYGEFGWEVATWAPWCRKQAAGYKNVVVTSFEGMGPLYADFATEFRSCGPAKRGLNYIKRYRPDGLYYRYGRKEGCEYFFDGLIHARGIGRKRAINYRNWDGFLTARRKLPVVFACIGTKEDSRVGDLIDCRGIGLQELMDLISRAKVVVGVSSGIMHLAAFCGTDIVTWGDRRTYFGETLEQRYKITWNPFNVRVGWIDADDFQPQPQQIVEKVKEITGYEIITAQYPASAW